MQNVLATFRRKFSLNMRYNIKKIHRPNQKLSLVTSGKIEEEEKKTIILIIDLK